MADYGKVTPIYSIPQYESGDKPNLRDQYNEAMDIIDTELNKSSENIQIAITAANNAANAAKTAADEAQNASQEAINAVAELAKIEPIVTKNTEDITTNTTDIATNKEDIETLNTELGGVKDTVDGNTDDIATLRTDLTSTNTQLTNTTTTANAADTLSKSINTGKTYNLSTNIFKSGTANGTRIDYAGKSAVLCLYGEIENVQQYTTYNVATIPAAYRPKNPQSNILPVRGWHFMATSAGNGMRAQVVIDRTGTVEVVTNTPLSSDTGGNLIVGVEIPYIIE